MVRVDLAHRGQSSTGEPIMDDLPPKGDEAEAQRMETIMPFVWGGIGIVAALGFTVWLFAR